MRSTNNEGEPQPLRRKWGRLSWVFLLAIAAMFVTGCVKTTSPATPPPGYPHAASVSGGQVTQAQTNSPLIDLKAVEKALWASQAEHPRDYQGWMAEFEDEVNAIYFAALRRRYPKADPVTLLERPVRVQAQRTKDKSLLRLYGYINEDGEKGFQSEDDDRLLFVLEQTRPFDGDAKTIHYSLRDGDGFYYRSPTYRALLVGPYANASFLNFWTNRTYWSGLHWRNDFDWWNQPYWQMNASALPWTRYYRTYPTFRRFYRTAYYNRYRPWGWNRGQIFRRGRQGRRWYYRGMWRRYPYRQRYRLRRRRIRRRMNRRNRRALRTRRLQRSRRSKRNFRRKRRRIRRRSIRRRKRRRTRRSRRGRRGRKGRRGRSGRKGRRGRR